MKVGDIVEIQPHIDQTRFNLFDKETIGIITSTLGGEGYCDVLLSNGRVVFVHERTMKLIK